MAKEIQTMLFDVSSWTVEKATKWLADHNMKHDKVDTTSDRHRFRQFDPEQCAVNSFETLTENFPAGVEGVACSRKSLEDADEDTFLKAFVAETKVLKNGDVEAYVSTEHVDRMGDIILAKGWDLENYKKTGSPVVFGHYYGMTPGGHIPHVGNAVQMEIQRKGLWSVTRFHEKTQLSRDTAVLYRERLMKSFSVGFGPKEKPEARTGENGEFLGYIFKSAELYEYSTVVVPANAEASQKAMNLAHKGVISRRTASLVAGPSPMAEPDSGLEGALLSAVQESALRSIVRRSLR